jgi:hypothetical protein
MMDVRQAMATTTGDLMWFSILELSLPQHDDIMVTSEEDNSQGKLSEEDENTKAMLKNIWRHL